MKQFPIQFKYLVNNNNNTITITITNTSRHRHMTLKQHNDIVQKLLKQLDQKQNQITTLKKQIQKSYNSIPSSSSSSTSYKSVPIDNSEALSKANLIQKQQKQKISALTQQLATKTIQNKDLNTKLCALKNIQAKSKEHAIQIMKKIGNITAYDSKVAAVVRYFQETVQKKERFIGKLKSQIKEYCLKLRKYQSDTKMREVNDSGDDRQDNNNNQQIIDNKNENNNKKGSNTSIDQSSNNNNNNNNIHTKYQQQLTKQKQQLQKYQKLFQQKSNQFKNLTKKYSDLTKQYYRIINQYGQKDKTMKIFKKQQNNILQQEDTSKQRTYPGKNPKNNNNSKGKFDGLLQQMVNSYQNQNNSNAQNSLSYSFLSNYNKIQPNNQSKISMLHHNHNSDTKQLQILQSFVNQIIELLNVQNRLEVIPKLTKNNIKLQQIQTFQNIVRDLHAMLYRLGFGKVPISQIKKQMEKLQGKIEKYAQNNDLLDQICIEIGSKKQKLIQKIRDMKATQQQFFKNMKDINFMQKLPKANKISEFIQYFELDSEICQLPEQLKKMYDQLKYIDKFLKQSALILGRQSSQGLQKSLEHILRYLERKQAEQALKKPEKYERIQNKGSH